MGELLGLPPHRLRNLAIGGLLHDIGKLSVADSILKKRGPLDEAEFSVIRKHPESGTVFDARCVKALERLLFQEGELRAPEAVAV